MKTRSLVVFTLLASLFIYQSGANDLGICPAVAVNEDAIFNICDFAEAGSFSLDYTDTSDILDPLAEYTFQLSLVVPQVKDCNSPNGTNQTQVYATVTYDPTIGNPECYDIAILDPSIEAIDPDNEDAGLQFVFPNNTASGFARQLVVQLTCDSTVTNVNLTNFTVSAFNSSMVIITAPSNSGCPTVSLSMLVGFFHKYKYIFLAIFLVLGIFICFFGFQVLKVTIFIIAAVGGTLLSASLFFEFTKMSTPKWALWAIFAACIVIGLVLGYIAVKIETLGFVALGVVLGGVGGLFLYNLVLAPFLEGKKAAFYAIIAVLGILGGLVAYKLWNLTPLRKVVVVGTAVIGAYMIVRAISVPIGGFPSEDSIASGVAHFSGWTYAYLVAMAIVAIAGGYFQWKRQKDKDFEEEDPYSYERVMASNV